MQEANKDFFWNFFSFSFQSFTQKIVYHCNVLGDSFRNAVTPVYSLLKIHCRIFLCPVLQKKQIKNSFEIFCSARVTKKEGSEGT